MNPARSFSSTDCAIVAIQSITGLSRRNLSFALGYRPGIGVTERNIIPILTALTGKRWLWLNPDYKYNAIGILNPLKVSDLRVERAIVIVPITLFQSHAAAVSLDKIHDNASGTKTIFSPIWKDRIVKAIIMEEEQE